jgi:dTDP-4-dehydrorhamnose reductase
MENFILSRQGQLRLYNFLDYYTMKTIIIGARGMLGQELAKIFQDWNPICWDRTEIDIADRENVNKKISEINPDLVINAAAYTNVDGAETEKELVMKINGEAVGYLAEACKKCGAILIHYSTDYVFDGKNQNGYKENDKPENSVNAYGQSKLLGEKMLQENTDRFYLIRTSWLFGKGGKNFVETMLTLAQKNETIRVVNDQHGKPTFAVDLAKKTKKLVEGKFPFGIYHITNENTCTWHEFAKEIFKIADVNVEVTPVSSDEFPTPAKRPAYSILINTKLPSSRPWQEALEEYLNIHP